MTKMPIRIDSYEYSSVDFQGFDGLILGLNFFPHRWSRTDADRWTDGSGTPPARFAGSRKESPNVDCPDDDASAPDDSKWSPQDVSSPASAWDPRAITLARHLLGIPRPPQG